MSMLNIYEAKTQLSKLVDQLEREEEREIVIARNGRPAARLLKWEPPRPEKRIGVAKGQFQIPADIDLCNDEVASLFGLGSK